jgi:hypothetical protein
MEQERNMEITDIDPETVSIRMDRKSEYSRLYAVLNTFRLELDESNIDLEMLMLSKNQVETFLDDFFTVDERNRQLSDGLA